jgi:WD40 repeat protein
VSYRPVLALALSTDSSRLAVACGNQVALYNLAATELSLVAHASAHLDPVQSIAWSPDGKRLATGGFRRVIIWNAESLTMQREISSGLTDRIAALEFLPNGKQLVIADGVIAEEGIVRIAEVESGAITKSWPAHGDTIFDLAISSDGKLLATAGGDKLVKIWNLETHTEVAKLEGHTAQVLTVAFDGEAKQLLTGGADQQLSLWDVKTKERIATLGKHTAAINAVAWTPAGPAMVAVTDAGSLLRYTGFKSHTGAQSSESAQERKLEAVNSTLYCVAVTANGERIFAGTHEGQLVVWNKDGKLVSKVDVNEFKATALLAK